MEVAPTISVYPSGGDWRVMSIAMMPEAPPRLSTTTETPNASLSFCATGRVVTSWPPPGAELTITRTGLLG